MYGMANVGIAGLNLHVFAYVTDIGFPTIVAATTLTIIASTQLGSTLIWGLISERIDIRHSSMVMFLVQAIGLTLIISFGQLPALYSGFFLYGVGLGGSFVLQELIWATYFGRLSLGTVRAPGYSRDLCVRRRGRAVFRFRSRHHRQLSIFVHCVRDSARVGRISRFDSARAAKKFCRRVILQVDRNDRARIITASITAANQIAGPFPGRVIAVDRPGLSSPKCIRPSPSAR